MKKYIETAIWIAFVVGFIAILIIQLPKAIDVELDMREQQAAEHSYHMEKRDFELQKYNSGRWTK